MASFSLPSLSSSPSHPVSTNSWYSLHAYSEDPEWAMWPVDTVFHTGMRRVSLRRILHRLSIRFAGLEKTKTATIRTAVASALSHRWGYNAWAIHLCAFNETLFVIRNTACTFQNPQERHVCVLHLEDALVHRGQLDATDLGGIGCLTLCAVFLLGLLMAWYIYMIINPCGDTTFLSTRLRYPRPFFYQAYTEILP